MKRKKKKENIYLCMKYGNGCKLCPRNNKCEEEQKRGEQKRYAKNHN